MKWIILQTHNPEDGTSAEWEAAGTVIAESAPEAVQVAASWPFIGRADSLRAVEWASASQATREDAGAEDRVRLEIQGDSLRSSSSLLMIGITTALLADFPIFNRALETRLGRSLRENEGGLTMTAYAALLYDVVAEIVGLPHDPEIVGQSAVMIGTTLGRLRIREIIASAL